MYNPYSDVDHTDLGISKRLYEYMQVNNPQKLLSMLKKAADDKYRACLRVRNYSHVTMSGYDVTNDFISHSTEKPHWLSKLSLGERLSKLPMGVVERLNTLYVKERNFKKLSEYLSCYEQESKEAKELKRKLKKFKGLDFWKDHIPKWEYELKEIESRVWDFSDLVLEIKNIPCKKNKDIFKRFNRSYCTDNVSLYKEYCVWARLLNFPILWELKENAENPHFGQFVGNSQFYKSRV